VGVTERALSRGKFELLSYLIQHTGRAISAEELVRAGVLAVSQRSRYRAIVLELRAHLGDARSAIRTVQGYGYRFEPPRDETRDMNVLRNSSSAPPSGKRGVAGVQR
jgi:DNA-binding response OmpR family regulator